MQVPPLPKLAPPPNAPPGLAPQQHLQALIDQQRGVEAVEYLSHGLGSQDAVWFATQSGEAVRGQTSPADQKALDAARQWAIAPPPPPPPPAPPGHAVALPPDIPEPLAQQVMEEVAQAAAEAPKPPPPPSPAGQAAAEAATASGLRGPGGWAAQSAAWADSAAAGGAPSPLVGAGVFGAVMLAASLKAGQPLPPEPDPASLQTVDTPAVPATPDAAATPPPADQAASMAALAPFIAIGVAIAAGTMVRG